MSNVDQVLLGVVSAGGIFLVATIVLNALLALKAEAEAKAEQEKEETHGN